MKAFVTGGTGFIGGHLVEALVNNSFDVTCLVRSNQNTGYLKLLKGVELIVGDLENEEILMKAARNADYIFHLGGISQTRGDISYKDFRKVNVIPTRKLAEISILNNVKRFVYYSSIEAVGMQSQYNKMGAIDESFIPKPENNYGKSKFESEELLMHLHKKKGLRLTIIRPSVVFGPRDLNHGPLKLFKAIESGMFHFIGTGDNLVSWCYVSNLIDATIQLSLNKNADGEIYFVSDEKFYTFRFIVEVAAKYLEVDLSKVSLPIWLALVLSLPIEFIFSIMGKDPILSKSKIRLSTSSFLYDTTKLKNSGYKQKLSLEVGIRETINWYKKHGYL